MYTAVGKPGKEIILFENLQVLEYDCDGVVPIDN